MRPTPLVLGLALFAASPALADDEIFVFTGNGGFSGHTFTVLESRTAVCHELDQSTAALPGDLSAHRIVLVTTPDTPFTAPETQTFVDYVAGGGTLVLMGDAPAFQGAGAAALNPLLTALGSTMQILPTNTFGGGCDIGPAVPGHPLVEGVTTMAYGYTSEVDVGAGTALLMGNEGQTVMAVEGNVILSADFNVFMDTCANVGTTDTPRFFQNLYAATNPIDCDLDVDGVDALDCGGTDCDDCDDQVDGSGFLPAFPDADGDGFGDPNDPLGTCAVVPGTVDNDGDCDDADGNVNPTVVEACDGIDNDCDGDIDEAGATGETTFYRDADGDGFGNLTVTIQACAAPPGFVADATDCDDTNGANNPTATESCDGVDNDCDGDTDEAGSTGETTFFGDADGDGFGDPATTVFTCNAPPTFVTNDQDCDDGALAVNPDATETCNGIDDDCDGDTDEAGSTGESSYYVDGDSDGFGAPGAPVNACIAPLGFVGNDTDCDDALDTVNPDATETCNGLDDDCDTDIDEAGSLGEGTFYADGDTDGFGDLATAVQACLQPVGFVADALDCDDTEDAINPDADELCDGVDNDCDGDTDEDDALDAMMFYADMDADGFGDLNTSTVTCVQPGGFVGDATDCDDAVDTVNPGADELCNGVDDDCDTDIDEDAIDAALLFADTDADGFGDALVSQLSCPTVGFVADGTDCDDGNDAVSPAAIETCNGVDDDCDLQVDEPDAVGTSTFFGDVDGDGFGDAAAPVIACDLPGGAVANDLDCDDADDTVNPDADELCNGVDDDCDTEIDEEAIDPSVFSADADNDSFGDAASQVLSCEAPTGFVADATDCDDASSAVNPGAAEVCNGLDDNCDAVIDTDASDVLAAFTDADGDGFGDDLAPQAVCALQAGQSLVGGDCDDASDTVNPDADELCNGVDDDCNGTIDDDATDAVEVFTDADADGYGAGAGMFTCEPAAGQVEDDTDCDDTNADVNPGATDLGGNGIDEDCSGSDAPAPVVDVDGDGFDDTVDCDDADPDVFPGAPEVDNGIDDDCDGEIDEGFPVPPTDTDDLDTGTGEYTGGGCGCSSQPAPTGLFWAVGGLLGLLARRRRG